jgi:hypothetical protein
VDKGPALIVPYPRIAGPEFQVESLNPTSFQAVPWSDPSSSYFQTEPFEISDCPAKGFIPAIRRTIHTVKNSLFIITLLLCSIETLIKNHRLIS